MKRFARLPGFHPRISTSIAIGALALFGLFPSTGAALIPLGALNTQDSAEDVEIVGSIAYVANGSSGLDIIDISDPFAPVNISSLDTPDYAADVEIVGSIAYVADGGSGLRIIDILDPTSPAEISVLNTSGYAIDVEVADTLAYIADGNSGIKIINISNAAAPVEIGALDTGGYAWDIEIVGTLIYLTDTFSGLRIIDVSDPSSPFESGAISTGSGAGSVEVVDDWAYVANGESGLRVVDISDPSAPVEIGTLDTLGYATEITVVGPFAYLTDGGSGLLEIDVSNPASPVAINTLDTEGYVTDVAVVGRLAYVTNLSSGLHTIDILPRKIGAINVSASDIEIEGSLVYLASGYSGFQIFDISDLSAPIEIVTYKPTHDFYAFEVEIEDSLAYVSNSMGQLYILDVSSPSNPFEIGTIETEGCACDLKIKGSLAFVADGDFGDDVRWDPHNIPDPGLRIIDVSIPSEPVEIGVVDTLGWAWGVEVVGSLAYVADGWGAEHMGYKNPPGLRIIDVSNPNTPFEIGTFETYALEVWDVAIVDNLAYLPTYLADPCDNCGSAGLLIVNISDPSAPRLQGYLSTNGSNTSIKIVGSFALMSNTENGLLIIDVSDPNNPVEASARDREGGLAYDLKIAGNRAFVAKRDSLTIFELGPGIVKPETDSDGDGIADNSDNCMGVYNPEQVDADSDGYGNLCDGDFNNDGAVGADDLGTVLVNLGSVNGVVDLNSDGAVGADDLGMILIMLGDTPGPSGLECAGPEAVSCTAF